MWTWKYWRDALERASSTAVETGIAVILAGGAATASGVDWMNVLDVAALAGLLALAKGYVASHIGEKTPSFISHE